MEKQYTMDQPSFSPAPLVVSTLRAQQAGQMERSLSQDIRDEREELREAAEQTLNAIFDLNLDGTIKWVSPSWTDVVGTPFETVNGIPISDLIVSENKTVFADVVDSMKRDDSKSYWISFSIHLGQLSKLRFTDSLNDAHHTSHPDPQTADLEAQGIMVYDSVSGGESHTIWMLRPWTGPHEIKIDLPEVIVDSLGSGAEVLASYLTRLAESGGKDAEMRELPPPSVLCRICERQIPPWWFEKHTDLCLQEHRAEMDVQMAQENLTEHRHEIVRVLDDLEARKSRSMIGEQQTGPVAEYNGMPIGPPPSAHTSPATSLARSRDRASGFGHARARSFAIRRPQARIVELLLDLCDTAMEISNPAIKESISHQDGGELRTQSPQSESRISQVLQWQSPSTNTVDQDQGLALLCSDTEKVARAKVDAVFRHRKIIEYAERIRIELAVLVQDCIDLALRKAARLAAGRMSDSTEDEEDVGLQETIECVEQDLQPVTSIEATRIEAPRGRCEDSLDERPLDNPSALAAALRQMDISDPSHRSRSRPTSLMASTRSSSPRECPTPRSHAEWALGGQLLSRDTRRASSLVHEAEAAEVEGSMRSSSVASRNAPRTDSPISEFGDLRRAANARQHHRRSLVMPGALSPRRQESPSRTAQPFSPLRIRPKVPLFTLEGVASPEASPMFPCSEFSSPVSHPSRHHRRQSSAAISDLVMRAPPSPRLCAGQAPPQPRPAQPSIKDFEIIKPISKGAFGSVYLSKKKSTGEYFAIKVLKKADMVAKNQVGNVKAERAIMMWQGQSDFVAKLYWTFSSKDYLYLVMEYLNGGDCTSLIKLLGGLPENWVKKYLGEVVLGVEHLHERDIIHRDLKPDNLLIDKKGHLKLTDFGLSRMGLVGRQKRALDSETADPTPDLVKQGLFARSTSMASSRSTSLDLHGQVASVSATPQTTPDASSVGQGSFFNLTSPAQEPRRMPSGHRSDSGGSEAMSHMPTSFSLNDSDSQCQPSSAKLVTEDEPLVHGSPDLLYSQSNTIASAESHGRSSLHQTNMMPPLMALFDPEDTHRRFVGTPDYLAPETIKGDKQDETSDWWSVGCIMFEFLCGIPPFHAGEAEQVFENILTRKIQWPDMSTCESISDEARDLINKLLCVDPKQRLGANRGGKFVSGGQEIRSHSWFQGINWETLLEDEAQFVPHPENPEDTEYFDDRGAVLQSFAEEIEDQVSPHSSTAGSDYPDRPHDALSRVRSQVNSINRKLMPLHIPPHVRDLKSRRLSEPVVTDDFGSFTFKNLPVLEKANKDVIQKLRADALAAHSKSSSGSPRDPAFVTSPAPSLDASPVLSNHLHRTISGAKVGNRPQSPSGFSHTNSSPSRASQPSSPLLVSFVAGQGTEGRRKASSNTSSLSHQSSSLQASAVLEVPKVPPSLQKAATSAAIVSPIKSARGAPLAMSPQKVMATPRQGSACSTSRSRSLTVGSQEASPVASEIMQHHRNRRSQVFDMSPSSSDNEGDKHNALLRVQRRRQSSRRLSQVIFDSGPTFKPLDVLICEDHPVARMVMEKLLEKLRCRTILVSNGSEAVRYSMSEIQFDVIFLEYKLPQINGADVARMIRETKNTNSHTPIVAITAYLKELQAPHYFDSLIEKPISSSKLTEVLRSLCQWRPESPQRAASGPPPRPISLGPRKSGGRSEESTMLSLPALAGRPVSGVASSREDSMAPGLFEDSESVTADQGSRAMKRKGTGKWEEGGLGIADTDMSAATAATAATSGAAGATTAAARGGALETFVKAPPPLQTQQSAPGQMEHVVHAQDKMGKREGLERKIGATEGTELADDEDDEGELNRDKRQLRRGSKPIIGKVGRPSSKLGIEMMRADSHESVAVSSESTAEVATQVATTPLREADEVELGESADVRPQGLNDWRKDETETQVEAGGCGPGRVEATPRPTAPGRENEEDATRRALRKVKKMRKS